jgi:hypothetical protein
MQRVLEIRDYKTAWLMAHKVRKAMADRDAGYTLAGLVRDKNLLLVNQTIKNPPHSEILSPP